MIPNHRWSLPAAWLVGAVLALAAGCADKMDDGQNSTPKVSSDESPATPNPSDGAPPSEPAAKTDPAPQTPSPSGLRIDFSAGATGATDEKEFRLAEEAMKIPDAPVSGTIAGQAFKPDKAELENGTLTIRQGKDFFPDRAVTIFLFLDDEEPPAGKTWLITGGDEFGNPHLHLKFKADGRNVPETEIVMDNYALKLEFGKPEEGRLPGRLFLQVPGKPGAKLAGTFTAELGIDLTQPPQDWERPWVLTKIELPNDQEHELAAGYVGQTEAGEWESNLAGTELRPGKSGFAASTTFEPRVTAVAWKNESLGLHGRHVRLSPGRYLFYVREGDNYLVWKTADVQADTALELKFQLDPSQSGKLTVKTAGAEPDAQVRIMPLTAEGQPPLEVTGRSGRLRLRRMIPPAKVKGGQAVFDGLAPGRYRIDFDGNSAEAQVESGKEATITLSGTESPG